MSARSGTASQTRYTATRHELPTGQDFDEFTSKFETAVPLFTPEQLDGVNDWNEVIKRVEGSAPHAFVFFFKMTPSNAMRIAGNTTRSHVYLVGNPVTVEGMYRHHPGVMLHAPFHVEIYETAAHDAVFAIETPSSAFASFGIEAVTNVGFELDRKVNELLEFLGVPRIEINLESA
jgi:hypothetical protein